MSIHVWGLRLTSDERTDVAVPDGYTTALVVRKGVSEAPLLERA